MELEARVTQTEFGRLVGVSQQAVSQLVFKGVLAESGSLGGWLLAYCENLRSVAGGRGGDRQAVLAEARTEEAKVNAALKNLEYQRQLGRIIDVAEAERVLLEWAGYANREYAGGTEKIVLDIEHEQGISVNRERVNGIARETVGRVQRHAEKLAASLLATEEEHEVR